MNAENLFSGYIAVYRSLLEHPLFVQHPPEYLKVWLYFLLKASRKPRQWWDGSTQHTIPIGGFIGSINTISSNCGVSRGQAERALRVLQKCAMVDVKPGRHNSLYVVTNFESYQQKNKPTETLTSSDRDTSETQTGHERDATGTQARRERDQTRGNREKVIGERQESNADDAFDAIYKRHPKKQNRHLAEQYFAGAVVEGVSPQAIAERHAEWCASHDWIQREGRFAPTLDAWLARKGWRDDAPPAPFDPGF